MKPQITRRAAAFGKNEDGAILVEFALILPLMLLLFAVTVESARMMMSYQAAVAGVRDAARYLARTIPTDICVTGDSVAGLATSLKNIVENDLAGNALFPVDVTINSVTPSYNCVAGTYRVSPAPVGVVSASVTMQFPLAGITEMFGGGFSSVTTTVTDQSRVFGQ